MITNYYKSLRTPTIQELPEYKRGTWVHAHDPSAEEIEELTAKFKLEPGILEDALDQDEVPRLDREGEVTYIFVRFAYKNDDGEVETAPLLIIFGGEYLITVSKIAWPAVAAFTTGRIVTATTQRAKLLLLLLSHISDQYDMFINQTSRKIKAIRSRLRGHGITNQDFIDFATIEDELNEFLGSLQPTNAVLRRLMVGRHLPLFEEDQDIVEDLMLNNEQSIEGSKSNLRSIENIRDAYSAISANNLNRTLTILTVATIIISLPSFAMGVYSMNMRLPFQTTHWIFWVVLAFNFCLMAVVALVARKKRLL